MQLVDIALGTGAAIGLGLLIRHTVKQPRLHSALTPSQPNRVNLERPGNQLPILDAQQLLSSTRTAGLVERIRTTLGLLPSNYERDVLPLLSNFAEYVQLLPASQSHHHAQPGGLLEHLLEVATFALTSRQGLKLPQNESTEVQIALGPVWSYGVLVAALLHDIGKPVADVEVTLYGDNPNTSIGKWNGLAGSMCELAGSTGATHYSVDFPDANVRSYGAHARLSTTLLHAIVPKSGLAWLGTDAKLLKSLVAYLDDGEEGVLKGLVMQADMTSVSENLKSGTRQRFANAKVLPLIERLMGSLQYLVKSGDLPMNRPGAPIFIDPDLEHLWIVAGTAADRVRQHLDAQEGATKTPTDNTRLFDTWQEFGACVTPPTEFGKGAVWWIRVETDTWQTILTMLKFRLSEVYKSEQLPQPFKGSLTAVSPNTVRTQSESDHTVQSVQELPQLIDGGLDQLNNGVDTDQLSGAPSSESDPISLQTIEPSSESSAGLHRDMTTTTSEPSLDFLNPTLPMPEEVNEAPAGESDLLDEKDAVSTAKATQAAPSVKKVQALGRVKPSMRKAGSDPKPNADAFMGWVQRGLGTGEILFNESGAFVHFVPEGLILISPKAFKEYLSTNAFVGSIGESKDALRALQREMQKAGYITFNKADNSHFFKYQTQSEATLGAPMTCYLVPNPQAYIQPVPSPNPLLVRVSDKKAEDPKE
jgi:integrating conjugative element relaxase (TIGR03760 family)